SSRNNRWTQDMATQVMGHTNGTKVFGDLGYWTGLRDVECSKQRLRDALNTPLPTGETVADRVMFGTDWYMLSKEDSYSECRKVVLDAIDDRATGAKVFGDNARKLFASL